jgi:hypothetical protein
MKKRPAKDPAYVAKRAQNVALTSFSVLVLGAHRAPSEQGRFTNIWMAVRGLRLAKGG